ncbi:MAG: penicillin-insensitive murein endopeptidase [Myxococcales bacterium]|nr:penicillin-insensitive murein endopeptidase [Myxococcales bacterium]
MDGKTTPPEDGPATPPEPDPLANLPDSISLGSPNDGTLEHAARLPDQARGLLRNPKSPNPDGQYGTREMVALLVRAARAVETDFPGSVLVVNDLSLAGGGPIYHHGSHQNGRDADVLFFYRHRDSEEVFPSKGIPVEPDGTGWDYGDLTDAADDIPVRLDVARTWRFAQALVEDPAVHVQRIFIVEHVRSMLLEEAQRMNAPGAAIERFAAITCQPSVPHDDHFHVRIFCASDDIAAGCEDANPIYPWHRDELATSGHEPVVAPYRRKAKSKKKARHLTVTAKEAEKSAGPMHEDVRAFLARRRTWMATPHPGRPYCR